ncbi:MAG: Spore germination protein B3 precursor [Firmicutes bacterium ADurb.Bin419]|nr:MAG: Spore germination protein B3 precursor [Firmicutes bacterium ADurb.Bin419]
MKTGKIILFAFFISLNSVLFSSCWNYREIDDMAIVSGVAIDKGINNRYAITPEIVQIAGGREHKQSSETVTIEGKSIFDAVRNEISVTGKKLYWSHTKVVIVSQEIAREGLNKVVDWYARDAEAREDVHFLISKDESAKEIFEGYAVTDDVISYELSQMLDNQKSLSKAPKVDLWDFANCISGEGISAVAPAISLKKVDGKEKAQIEGTAIFKKDKLLGFIDGEDTQAMLFIKNEVKGGVIVCDEIEKTFVSLEIFKSKTKIKPICNGKGITMGITIELDTAIDEVGDTFDPIEEEGRKKLKEHCEGMLNERFTKFIKKIQSEYGADIFGFGAKIREDNPSLWKAISKNWGEEFKNLKINVSTKLRIRNSAQMSKILEVED